MCLLCYGIKTKLLNNGMFSTVRTFKQKVVCQNAWYGVSKTLYLLYSVMINDKFGRKTVKG